MSNSLIITKETGNYFSLALNSEPIVRSEQNRLTTVGDECHFKTATGANIIKEQSVLFSEITLIAGGSFTFSSVQELWDKLIEVDFFIGLGGSGGGGTGVDRFTELIDTFNSYLGRDGHTLIVNESQLKLESVPLYNFKKFIELQDTPSVLLPNKMITTNNDGTALVMSDIPSSPETYLNSVGFFYYSDNQTQTTSLPLVANTPLKLINDGLGESTNKNYPPYGITDVWNSIDNQINFSQLTEGDEVGIRIDVEATTTIVNQNIEGHLKVNVGTANEYNINLFSRISKVAQDNKISLFTKLSIDSNDLKINPLEFYLTSDANASIKIKGWYFSIIRRNINVISVETVEANRFGVDLTYTSGAITVPSGTKIRNVFLNNIPCSASEWSQTGTDVTILTAINGDLVTLTN